MSLLRGTACSVRVSFVPEDELTRPDDRLVVGTRARPRHRGSWSRLLALVTKVGWIGIWPRRWIETLQRPLRRVIAAAGTTMSTRFAGPSEVGR